MIGARPGIPGNGKPFPEGSMIAKIEWLKKKNPESPCSAEVPDTLSPIANNKTLISPGDRRRP